MPIIIRNVGDKPNFEGLGDNRVAVWVRKNSPAAEMDKIQCETRACANEICKMYDLPIGAIRVNLPVLTPDMTDHEMIDAVVVARNIWRGVLLLYGHARDGAEEEAKRREEYERYMAVYGEDEGDET